MSSLGLELPLDSASEKKQLEIRGREEREVLALTALVPLLPGPWPLPFGSPSSNNYGRRKRKENGKYETVGSGILLV